MGGPLSKLCVTPPFSINLRCQIENQVSDYRLLGASSYNEKVALYEGWSLFSGTISKYFTIHTSEFWPLVRGGGATVLHFSEQTT